MKEPWKAKLQIKGLNKMKKKEVKQLISWLEARLEDLKEVYAKPMPTKEYSNNYTARLME
jgi:hypothetical protein